MGAIVFHSWWNFAALYYIVLLAGIGLGSVLVVAWWKRDSSSSREDLRAELQAMRAAERLAGAAWASRHQMHEAAAHARRRGNSQPS